MTALSNVPLTSRWTMFRFHMSTKSFVIKVNRDRWLPSNATSSLLVTCCPLVEANWTTWHQTSYDLLFLFIVDLSCYLPSFTVLISSEHPPLKERKQTNKTKNTKRFSWQSLSSLYESLSCLQEQMTISKIHSFTFAAGWNEVLSVENIKFHKWLISSQYFSV